MCAFLILSATKFQQKLIDNTKAFVEGKKANNCLLFGDAGTGKILQHQGHPE